MPTPDISALSDSEITDLATRCLDALPLDAKVQAVMKSFTENDERDELIAWLSEEPDAEEE